MKKSALTYLVLLLLSSCIYPFSVEKGDAEFSDIVVSGDILIGEQSRIQLGYVFPVGTFPTEMRRDFPTGSLTIENEDGGRWRGDYQSRGLYVFDTSDAPAEGRYRLHIIINDGAEYVSEWMGVHQAPAIHNLKADCDGEYVNISMDLEGADSLWNFRWDYNQTWEYHADYYPDLMFVPGLPEKDRENPEKIYRLPTPEEDYYYCWTSAPSVEPGLASAEGQSINSDFSGRKGVSAAHARHFQRNRIAVLSHAKRDDRQHPLHLRPIASGYRLHRRRLPDHRAPFHRPGVLPYGLRPRTMALLPRTRRGRNV